MNITVRFPLEKRPLLNGMAKLSDLKVAEYLGDLVEQDARRKGVPIPKTEQPKQAA